MGQTRWQRLMEIKYHSYIILVHNVFTVNKPNPEWVSYREYVQKIFPLTSEPEATE